MARSDSSLSLTSPQGDRFSSVTDELGQVVSLRSLNRRTLWHKWMEDRPPWADRSADDGGQETRPTPLILHRMLDINGGPAPLDFSMED